MKRSISRNDHDIYIYIYWVMTIFYYLKIDYNWFLEILNNDNRFSGKLLFDLQKYRTTTILFSYNFKTF